MEKYFEKLSRLGSPGLLRLMQGPPPCIVVAGTAAKAEALIAAGFTHALAPMLFLVKAKGTVREEGHRVGAEVQAVMETVHAARYF
ncbi:hypothetical protein IV500_07380 [Paeniglutamicibacter antarcticus]|uniref:Uncharacterized protein n=1 Tax=Arthrobacter terrae TaxID=2935737 RepID=A0A931G3Z4_9MICC|nr:hypothetical protein [Arthrobacter terrae]MBG0739211.1 hypothetical protein [Arthrobacter terrae]